MSSMQLKLRTRAENDKIITYKLRTRFLRLIMTSRTYKLYFKTMRTRIIKLRTKLRIHFLKLRTQFINLRNRFLKLRYTT